MGNFFSPLVWPAASSSLRQPSEGELPKNCGVDWRGIFSCRFPQSRHSPSFPSLPFTHRPPAVLVKPGNSLLNYRRGGKTGEEEREKEKEKEVVNFEPFPTNTPNYS